MRRPILIVVALLTLAGIAAADEGMWLFNLPPTQQLKSRYGFDLTKSWLQHTQLSSVRFNNGGSGSFVSPNGLTFTNHHVGSECIQQLSTGGKDYLKSGFYAKTEAEEAKCPDLELNVLEEIEDVTAKVNAAVKPGTSVADQGQAQRAAMSTIEQDCVKETKLRCDVVTLYSGAMYHLYRYKKYTDVRLVFAPEFQAAFFGGDPDNFEYPRYDLDITFFRIYENDKPVSLDNYLRWSRDGVKEGDLVFVSGHPGSTGRLLTTSQLEFLRDVDYPTRLNIYKQTIDVLKNFSGQSPENERIAQEELFGYENSFKGLVGYMGGLQDKDIIARKAADEDKLRSRYKADARNPGSDPWQEIANAVEVEREIYKPLTYLERRRGFNSDLARFARTLVRVTE